MGGVVGVGGPSLRDSLRRTMSTEPTPGRVKLLNTLFDHNPPESEALILSLYCNRTTELERGLDGLRALDGAPKIHAIHGLPRSGKSHFAKVLLLKAKEEALPFLFVEVNANNRGSAKAVLEEVFFKFLHLIRGVPAEQIPEGQTAVYDEYLAELSQYENVVGRTSAQFTMERSSTIRSMNEGRFDVGLAPFKIRAAGKNEAEEGDKSGLVQTSLSERELTEILRYAIDALGWLYSSQRILLLVDDLDLLDRKGREGQPQSELLVDYLQMLAEPPTLAARPPCLVLATVRNASFTDRDKDFRDFVGLGLLEPENHLEIYQRHIELLNAGAEVFAPDTLRWLEERSGGQIGMFLRRCHEVAFHFYKDLKAGNLITIEQIKRYVKKDIRDLIRNPELASVMSAVIGAVRSGQPELVLSDSPGALEFKVLTQTSEPQKYRINDMYLDVLRELISRQELS